MKPTIDGDGVYVFKPDYDAVCEFEPGHEPTIIFDPEGISPTGRITVYKPSGMGITQCLLDVEAIRLIADLDLSDIEARVIAAGLEPVRVMPHLTPWGQSQINPKAEPMNKSTLLAAALAMTATTGFAPRSTLTPGAGANKGKPDAKAKRKAKLAYKSKRRNRK